MCVCDLTGLVRERGDRVDAAFARPVSVAGVVRHRVPPRDLGHVTDCVEAPLARSWPDLVFSVPLRGSGVASVARMWCQVFPVSRPVPSGDAIEIAVSVRIFTTADAGCGCHVFELDVTALSAECQ